MAGTIIVAGGIEIAFAVNAKTCLALIGALWAIDVAPQTREHTVYLGMFSQIGAGYTYVSAHRGIGRAKNNEAPKRYPLKAGLA